MKYLRTASFAKLVRALGRDYDVYAPFREGTRYVLGRVDPEQNGDGPPVAWNPARLGESLKPLWFQTSKVVSRWTAEGPEAGPTPRPRAIVGAKACDLAALGIIDKVFRDHTFQEPGWCAAREQNLIISGDCTTCLDSCFCTMVGHAPHPTEHFDLNLSPLDDGFGVEVGSPRARRSSRPTPTSSKRLPRSTKPRASRPAPR